MRIVVATLLLTAMVLPASVFADPGPRTDVTRTDVTKMVTPEGFPRTKDAGGPSPPLDPSSSVADDCARARRAGKTCVLDVPPEDVGGQTPTAGDAGTRILIFGTQTSLIRIRRDFIPELVKTAEDL